MRLALIGLASLLVWGSPARAVDRDPVLVAQYNEARQAQLIGQYEVATRLYLELRQDLTLHLDASWAVTMAGQVHHNVGSMWKYRWKAFETWDKCLGYRLALDQFQRGVTVLEQGEQRGSYLWSKLMGLRNGTRKKLEFMQKRGQCP